MGKGYIESFKVDRCMYIQEMTSWMILLAIQRVGTTVKENRNRAVEVVKKYGTFAQRN